MKGDWIRMTEKFQGRECIILWEIFGKLFYFINYNSFEILERMDSAVPQQSARVC